MASPKILIFIPTYNESGNVERMANELAALELPVDIVFLDDNSPDGTGAILNRMAATISSMDVIHRQGKEGIGSAHQAGITQAYAGGYDILITLDCDFTHDPSDIPKMLAALPGHDMVVGSRYMERGSLPGWNLMRRCLTMFGHFLTSTLLGLPQDASGAFRAYDLRRIDQRIFSLVGSRSYSFFFESLFVLYRNGCDIAEIPIVLPVRTYGSSKLTPGEAIRGGMYLLGLWLRALVEPERFAIGRAPDSTLADVPSCEWDGYWTRGNSAGNLLYTVAAACYRRLFIRPNLTRVLRRHFTAGARLLHAGCGSGQADVGLHEFFKITAVDLSLSALRLYGRNNPIAESIRQADLFTLPFANESFDGIFNLGVMEHFDETEIAALLKEFHRILRPGGKIILFWPHAKGTSVRVLGALHYLLNDVLGKNVRMHPDEITLISGREQACGLLNQGGFALSGYDIGWRDLFVQAVVVGVRK